MLFLDGHQPEIVGKDLIIEKDQNNKSTTETLLSAWIKASIDFWGSPNSSWPGAQQASDDGVQSEDNSKNRVHEYSELMFKIWYPIFLILSEEKTREVLHKGINTLPEIVSKMAKTGWEAYDNLQQKLMERLGKTGKYAEDFKFEDLDQDMFKAWIDIYKEEIKQFLSIPQMGITNLYQERMNQVVNKFNLFQAAIAEFSHVLYMNMEESFRIMQERVDKLKEEGKQPKDLKEYYLIWLKILESNYKNLLKSPKYTEIMNKTLVAMEDFFKARQNVLQDVLQTLPVVTKKEMDQLSKQIYLLNKQVKELTKKVNKL